MSATHAKKPTANFQKAATALVASITTVSASFVAASPHAKTVAAQLPEITTQVKLTAGSDPISLIEGLLALPASIVQELGNGQWINNLPYLVAQPLAAADSVLYALDTAAAPVVMNGLMTLLSPIATTPVAQALQAALQVYFKNAAFPPTGFQGSGGLGLNFIDIATAAFVDFGAPAFALFPTVVTLAEKLGIPLPLPGNLVPNAATDAALAPAITPADVTPQDLVGGLGGVLTGALGTAWTDGAYLLNTALNIGVGVGWPLLTDGPALLFHPDGLVNFFTSYALPVIQYSISNGLYGIVSTTTQFLSSLAGLLPTAAAPLAATSVPKVQTNLIKVSNPTAATTAPNAAAGSKQDKTDSSNTGSLKARSKAGGKHSKPIDSVQNGSSQTGAGAGKAGGGENKSGNDSHDGDRSKHSSGKSGSHSHGTGDGHGSAGSHGGSGGHGGGK